jgi:hypothetical protein
VDSITYEENQNKSPAILSIRNKIAKSHVSFMISNDFSHHYVLSKGESWSNWGLNLILLTEN